MVYFANRLNPSRLTREDLEVYNLLGQQVVNLVNDYVDEGQHYVDWDASGFSSGIYICRLATGGASTVKRITLLK